MFKDYFNHASQLIYIISSEGVIKEANDAVVALTGIEKSDIVGRPLWELSCWLHSEMMQNRMLFSMEECALTMKNSRFAAQYKDYKHEIVDLDFVIKPVFDKDEVVDYFVGLGYNITELVSARKALSDRERQMSALFERANEGFMFSMLPQEVKKCNYDQKELTDVIVEHQKLIRWNNSFKEIFGLTDDLIKQNPNALTQLKIDAQNYINAIGEMLDCGECTHEYSFKLNEKHAKTVTVTFSSIEKDEFYYGNFCVVTDLTLTRQYEHKLKALASTDFLTGLNNRRTFFTLAQSAYEEKNASLIAMLDIDKFKNVNDTYGHDSGDLVLKNFSRLLSKTFDRYGIIARLGGEEFAVIITEMDAQSGVELFEQFRIAFHDTQHKTEDGQMINVSVSVGIYRLDNANQQEVDCTLKKADLALYKAKQTGRNRVVIYDHHDKALNYH